MKIVLLAGKNIKTKLCRNLVVQHHSQDEMSQTLPVDNSMKFTKADNFIIGNFLLVCLDVYQQKWGKNLILASVNPSTKRPTKYVFQGLFLLIHPKRKTIENVGQISI